MQKKSPIKWIKRIVIKNGVTYVHYPEISYDTPDGRCPFHIDLDFVFNSDGEVVSARTKSVSSDALVLQVQSRSWWKRLFDGK